MRCLFYLSKKLKRGERNIENCKNDCQPCTTYNANDRYLVLKN